MWQPLEARIDRGDLPSQERQNVDSFVNEVVGVAKKRLEALDIHGVSLPWERPHSRVVWYARNFTILVGEPLSGGMATLVYQDGRKQPDPQPRDIVAIAQRDVGFRSPFFLVIPTSYIEMPEDTRKGAVHSVVEVLVSNKVREHKFVSELGITDALTYLRNAGARFEEGTPQAMADVKTNCRNAIDSLVLKLAGTTDYTKAAKALTAKDIFAKHEGKFVLALVQLLDAFSDVASFPGAHPPFPTKEDASFVLQVTETTINYIATRALNAQRASQ